MYSTATSGSLANLRPAGAPAGGSGGMTPASSSLLGGNAASGPVSVTFDEFGKLRLVPPATTDASEKLKEECRDLTSKVSEFTTLVSDLLTAVTSRAAEIEREKRRAVALRTAVEREPARRVSELNRISFLLRERQMQLDRLTAQYETYAKVEAEQTAVIESLTSK
ncbi:hypothetical protein H9P43_006600 [Blastocladiella emersonii ATCC 22665]|nr:hypothetical protein H9P43_006600 [Blastocladiella emersonii ATCC 22665]